jgi:hypothetical protein
VDLRETIVTAPRSVPPARDWQTSENLASKSVEYAAVFAGVASRRTACPSLPPSECPSIDANQAGQFFLSQLGSLADESAYSGFGQPETPPDGCDQRS